jgi:Glyoxalase/Bleomycin resistance protein/Dioxygenase superfamily
LKAWGRVAPPPGSFVSDLERQAVGPGESQMDARGEMIHIREIDHVEIRTGKLDKMIRFYCDVLGCEVERRLGAIGLVQMRAGRSLIDLGSVEARLDGKGVSPSESDARNMNHLSLRIELFNIEEICTPERARRRGERGPDELWRGR